MRCGEGRERRCPETGSAARVRRRGAPEPPGRRASAVLASPDSVMDGVALTQSDNVVDRPRQFEGRRSGAPCVGKLTSAGIGQGMHKLVVLAALAVSVPILAAACASDG